MNKICFILGLSFLFFQTNAQKSMAIQTSNLNLSKSNINRLIYPGTNFSSANAKNLLLELEKLHTTDQEKMKMWLTNNFRRFSNGSGEMKQIFVFSLRKFEDCTNCKKFCKGRCVQDPGADCVCISHSEPNLRTTDTSPSGFMVFLYANELDESKALEMSMSVIQNIR
ncbi:MAG: hypothetical protein WBP08_02690 [Saprospiraceae bacterium]